MVRLAEELTPPMKRMDCFEVKVDERVKEVNSQIARLEEIAEQHIDEDYRTKGQVLVYEWDWVKRCYVLRVDYTTKTKKRRVIGSDINYVSTFIEAYQTALIDAEDILSGK